MPVDAINAISSIGAATGTGGATSANSAPGTGGSSFSTALSGAVDNLQQLQGTSDTLAVQAVTGNLDDIHKATTRPSTPSTRS